MDSAIATPPSSSRKGTDPSGYLTRYSAGTGNSKPTARHWMAYVSLMSAKLAAGELSHRRCGIVDISEQVRERETVECAVLERQLLGLAAD